MRIIWKDTNPKAKKQPIKKETNKKKEKGMS